MGLMSGTSLDGVDAALVRIVGTTTSDFAWELVAFRTDAYDDARRASLRDALERGAPESLCHLHAALGEWQSEAVHAVCADADITTDQLAAIGSHGQTVWHAPSDGRVRGATLQLGDAATLAERTGAPVVSDFRSRDVAAGGQGAPLVAWPDRLLFSVADRRRALQNLGGMANVTWLPPVGSREPVLAFDTGPGVALLDEAARRASDGALAFDLDGSMARRGSVDQALLTRLLDDDFFRAEPPKSTGRERFGGAFMDTVADGLSPGSEEDAWCDLIATLVALTARSIGDAYRTWVLPRGVDEVFLLGGGARNPALTDAVRSELAPVTVREGEDLGIDPDAREALAFAVLAWAHLHGLSGNLPEATGAQGPRVLGTLTPGVPR